MTRYPVMASLFGFAVLAACLFATTQQGNGQTPPNPGPQPPAYRPGLGDLMTMTVQPRHIKLGLAGRENNWSFAAYELHELEESFERVARYWPQWKKKPIADMMTSVTKDPMIALDEAIKAADAARFEGAYKQLTDGCNTCHQSAEVGVIVIQVPDTSPFPDQDFRPVKR